MVAGVTFIVETHSDDAALLKVKPLGNIPHVTVRLWQSLVWYYLLDFVLDYPTPCILNVVPHIAAYDVGVVEGS